MMNYNLIILLIPTDALSCGVTDNCDVNATCIDDNGSYICVCKDGFTGDGFNCIGEGWSI